jgi:hypothetical protein
MGVLRRVSIILIRYYMRHLYFSAGALKGDMFVSPDDEGSVRIWDLRNTSVPLHTASGRYDHFHRISHMVFRYHVFPTPKSFKSRFMPATYSYVRLMDNLGFCLPATELLDVEIYALLLPMYSSIILWLHA